MSNATWVKRTFTQEASYISNNFKRLLLNMRLFILLLAGSLFPAYSIGANASQFIDAEIVVYDDRFYKFIGADSQAQVLADELGWAEGPVWVESLDALLFSDVAADKIFRWDESSGLTDYLFPSGHAPDSKGTAWRGSNGLEGIKRPGHRQQGCACAGPAEQ